MTLKTLEVGDRIVICPDWPSSFRGASGIIISRTLKKRKNGNDRIVAILVRWTMHRKGVNEIRLVGKPRKKSNRYKNGYIRTQEWSAGHHSIDYCIDCPRRLLRLVSPCPGTTTKKKSKNDVRKDKH